MSRVHVLVGFGLAVLVPGSALACDPGDVARIGAAHYADLQQALDALVDGDTLLVCPGVHRGRFETSLAGAVTITSWDGDPRSTVLDGEGLGTVLRVDGPLLGYELTLRDLTLRDGASSWDSAGAALDVYQAASTALDRVIVSDNRGPQAAVHILGGDATVTRSLFRDNTATIIPSGLEVIGWGDVTLEDSRFVRNGMGGALLDGDAVTVRRTDFVDHRQAALTVTGDLTEVTDATFRGGIAYGSPAAMLFGSSTSTGLIADCVFEGNTNPDPERDGIVLAWGRFTLRDSLFGDNVSGDTILTLYPSQTATLERVAIVRNQGLAIGLDDPSGAALAIVDSVITANTVGGIGRIAIAEGPSTPFSIQVTETDFGTGTRDNGRFDVLGCGPLGDRQSFVYEPFAGVLCQ